MERRVRKPWASNQAVSLTNKPGLLRESLRLSTERRPGGCQEGDRHNQVTRRPVVGPGGDILEVIGVICVGAGIRGH